MTSKETPRIAPDNSGESEIVLPSGSYARLRKLNPIDLCVAYSANPFEFICSIMTMAVRIDGENVTVEMLKEMPLDDWTPISNMIAKALSEANKFQGGIK